jgi:catechol 2,3-dioxygenase-like lactoylglutathione lyase family enzyme
LVSIPGGNVIYAAAGLAIFGAFTIVDFNRLRRANADGPVLIASSIFLDVFNIFLPALDLFGGRRDQGVTVSTKFEVTTLPVADVDRAKAFYKSLGWRLDIDFKPSPDTRAVQFTPPGSPASIQFGEGTTTMTEPLQGLLLVVDDIVAARDDLIDRGVDVGEIWHLEIGKGPVPGVDPERRTYSSRASFADPDGNTWTLQEITERLPGRVEAEDPAALAQLLMETALHHDAFEKAAPPHDWWDWYAAYMSARQAGSTSEEASGAAGRYMAEAKHVVVAPD